MPAMPAVVAQLHCGKPGRFDAAIGEHFALVPTKAEEGCLQAIIAWVEHSEIQEVRMERFILMAEDTRATAGLKRANSLMGTLINVPLLASGRILRIGLPV